MVQALFQVKFCLFSTITVMVLFSCKSMSENRFHL
uniref:Uncharacterized protein n=1 Tax=Rhizophora mucronata TaxID=61149 RepID=A0A2P2LKY9_RHIMU